MHFYVLRVVDLLDCWLPKWRRLANRWFDGLGGATLYFRKAAYRRVLLEPELPWPPPQPMESGDALDREKWPEPPHRGRRGRLVW